MEQSSYYDDHINKKQGDDDTYLPRSPESHMSLNSFAGLPPGLPPCGLVALWGMLPSSAAVNMISFRRGHIVRTPMKSSVISTRRNFYIGTCTVRNAKIVSPASPIVMY